MSKPVTRNRACATPLALDPEPQCGNMALDPLRSHPVDGRDVALVAVDTGLFELSLHRALALASRQAIATQVW